MAFILDTSSSAVFELSLSAKLAASLAALDSISDSAPPFAAQLEPPSHELGCEATSQLLIKHPSIFAEVEDLGSITRLIRKALADCFCMAILSFNDFVLSANLSLPLQKIIHLFIPYLLSNSFPTLNLYMTCFHLLSFAVASPIADRIV